MSWKDFDMLKKITFFFIFLLIFSVGLAVGRKTKFSEPQKFSVMRSGGYRFINPLLEFDIAEISNEPRPFKSKIQTKVQQLQADKKIRHISVYFRDLNNGPWFGINEKEKYAPASLLKVPVMISYLKAAETNPELLQKTLRYETEYLDDYQYIKPSMKIELGKEYTIEDLISRMIKHSDNLAGSLLRENMNTVAVPLEKVLSDFGVDFELGVGDELSVKNYASFFRILFNSSYLNRESSEKALDLLSQTEFDDGLVAGVPQDLAVSHKFGERSSSQTARQLHDCGIIYYPKHPYLLCTMTRGTVGATGDYVDISKAIGEISRLVYEEIDWQFRGK